MSVGGAADIPRGEVGGGDHVAADLLEHVRLQRVDDGRPDQRHHELRRRGEAQGEVALAVARLRQRPDNQLAVGLGDAGGAHPDRPRHLQHPVLGQAGIAEGLHPSRRLQVRLRPPRFVGVRIRNAEGGAEASQLLEVDADNLSDFPRRVATPVAGEGALHWQQRQPPRPHCRPQLLQRHALRGQLSQQRRAGLAARRVEVVEQPLGREIDLRGGAHLPAFFRFSGCAVRNPRHWWISNRGTAQA